MIDDAAVLKPFPRRGQGVLLPTDDRYTAALGICMYTACRPAVLRAQAIAHRVVRLTGARVLPTGGARVEVPGSATERAGLLDAWTTTLGAIDSMAVYQRRQSYRDGLTFVAVRASRPLAVVKLRGDTDSLDHEQRALEALRETAHPSFGAPEPLGAGRVGPWSWSAQSVVFERPHRPVLEAPAGLFDEVTDVLSSLAAPTGEELPAHRDLTPWNLRRDTDGRVWLFDWEDWGLAPAECDRAYFCASARAVGGPPMPRGLPGPVIEYHRAIVEERKRRRAPGVTLPDRLLAALDEAS